MELTDLMTEEQWIDLEKEVHRRWNLDASVFNTNGVRITGYKEWVNRLCPAIKDTPKGQAFICAVAHMNLAIMAGNTGKAVVEECDGGMVKIVIPIIVDGTFIGAFGACGALLDDGEVDEFLINRVAGLEETEIEKLSDGIPVMTSEQADELCRFVEHRLAEAIQSRG